MKGLDEKYMEFFMIELIRAGCSLEKACRLLGMSIHQGRYLVEKQGCKVRDIKRCYSIRYKTPKALAAAHRLLVSGATGEEVAMITGLNVDQICYFDKFGCWMQGEEDTLV